MVLFFKSLHVTINLLYFSQENNVAHRQSILEAGNEYEYREPDKNIFLKLGHSTTTFVNDHSTWLLVFLFLRSTLIHSIIGWVYKLQILDVVNLGEQANSPTTNSVPSIFWTFGISFFNTARNSVVLLAYGGFTVTVFILGPALLIEGGFHIIALIRQKREFLRKIPSYGEGYDIAMMLALPVTFVLGFITLLLCTVVR